MSYYIGFAEKMYTLWEGTRIEKDGIKPYIEYSYIKNISSDLDKVKSLYPDVEIDLTLKGTKTIVRSAYTYVAEPLDVFNFGKYKGMKVEDCPDYSYLSWYFDQVSNERKEIIIPILEEQGYGVVKHNDNYWQLFKPQEWKEHLEFEEKKSKVLDMAKSGEPLTLTAETNLDQDGEIYIEPIWYKFGDFKVLEYRGYPYGLPTINGKAKRIKGKEIRVTECEVIDEQHYEIIIKKFELV